MSGETPAEAPQAAPQEATPAVETNAAPVSAAGTPAQPTPESNPAETPAVDTKEGETVAPSLFAEDDEDEAPKDKADGPADADKGDKSETYEAFTLPEGVSLEGEDLTQVTAIFKEAKLSQDAAQKLVSHAANAVKNATDGLLAEQRAGHTKMINDWYAETKAHPEFGGAKLKESKALAVRALDALGSNEAKHILQEYGLDRNPHIFGLLVRAGAKLLPDTLVRADAAAQQPPRSAAEIMWPSMFKSKE